MQMGKANQYFGEFLQPRAFNGLNDLLEFGLPPRLKAYCYFAIARSPPSVCDEYLPYFRQQENRCSIFYLPDRADL